MKQLAPRQLLTDEAREDELIVLKKRLVETCRSGTSIYVGDPLFLDVVEAMGGNHELAEQQVLSYVRQYRPLRKRKKKLLLPELTS